MRSGEGALEVVAHAYYRDPDPALATRALGQWLELLASADEAQLGRLIILMYVLARISQRSAEARAAFEPVLHGYRGPHEALAQRVLAPQLPDVLHATIERPENLDLLWAEFFVTGEAAPIERIFTALDAPDHVRARLEAWLAESPLFGKGKRRDAAAALSSAGLVVDLERRAITSTGDLDCRCFALAERRIPIFKLLPFELSPAGLQMLACKGAAVWSLRLNARDHERVAEIVAVEARRRGGPGRLLALEPVPAGPPFAL